MKLEGAKVPQVSNVETDRAKSGLAGIESFCWANAEYLTSIGPQGNTKEK